MTPKASRELDETTREIQEEPARRGWLSGLAMVAVVAAVAALIVYTALQQSPITVERHRLIAGPGGQPRLEVVLENRGKATTGVLVRVSYFQQGTDRQATVETPVGRLAGDGATTTVRTRPLTGLDPERRERYTIYVGTGADPYAPGSGM